MQTTSIEIRDKRNQDWYWMNNLFVDQYGEIVGTHAVAVYSVLCRHANNDTQECFPSMETIGKKAGIKSRKTVSKAIETLEHLHIIEVEKAQAADGKRLNNIYRLRDPKSWIGTNFKTIATVEFKNEGPNPVELASELISRVKAEEVDRAVYPWLHYEMWQEWVAYRKGIKKKLTPLTIKQQISFLEKNKADHAEIIRTSIMNGWTGLFPLKKKAQPSNVQPVAQGKYSKIK